MYQIFCDGAARGQGVERSAIGKAAAAVVIYRNRRVVGQYARGLGAATNNQAEYEAVLLALLLAWAGDLQDPVIYSDSMVVVKQVNGEWRCNTDKLRPLLLSIKEIQEVFPFRLVHVARSYVAEADALANAFLDRQELHERESIQDESRRRR